MMGLLVVTSGGGPSGEQRRAMRRLFERHGRVVMRSAAGTDSLLVRGITNAVNLLNTNIRSFASEIDTALLHIRGLMYCDALLALLDELRGRLVSETARAGIDRS